MKDTENRPPSRKRRKWGSVIVRRDTDGNPTSFQARYVNPLNPPKKVGRNFGLEYETEAYKWLDEEHLRSVDWLPADIKVVDAIEAQNIL